jgi:hypothetical protein
MLNLVSLVWIPPPAGGEEGNRKSSSYRGQIVLVPLGHESIGRFTEVKQCPHSRP